VRPGATEFTSPFFVTVAMLSAKDVQVATSVRSWELPSVYVPVANNCWDFEGGAAGLLKLTAIEAGTGADTTNTVVLVIEPDVTWIVAWPWEMAVTSPA